MPDHSSPSPWRHLRNTDPKIPGVDVQIQLIEVWAWESVWRPCPGDPATCGRDTAGRTRGLGVRHPHGVTWQVTSLPGIVHPSKSDRQGNADGRARVLPCSPTRKEGSLHPDMSPALSVRPTSVWQRERIEFPLCSEMSWVQWAFPVSR